MKLSLNDYMDVKLSELGRRIVADKPHLLGWDLSNGRMRFQLWHAMNVFGPFCGLGEDSPFEGEIDIVLAGNH